MATEVYKADFITCPYCGHVHKDMCDYPWGTDFSKDEDEAELDCDICEKRFTVTLSIEHYFSTYQKEQSDD